MKTYSVLVSWTDAANVAVEAESEKQAQEIAVALMEEGRAEYLLDQSNAAEYKAIHCGLVDSPDELDKKHAAMNAEAWEVLQEENA